MLLRINSRCGFCLAFVLALLAIHVTVNVEARARRFGQSNYGGPSDNGGGSSYLPDVMSQVGRGAGSPVNTVIRKIGGSGTVSATSGFINVIIPLDPSVATAGTTYASSSFTSIRGLFDEYRVLGGRVTFFSKQQFTTAATAASLPIVVIFDNDDATNNLGSYSQALEYEVSTKFAAVWDNSFAPTLTFSRPSTDDGQALVYTATAAGSPTNQCSVKLYGGASTNGLTGTLPYLDYIVELTVEFRGSI